MADISRLNKPSYSLGYVTGPITCWNNLVVQHNWGKDQEGFAWLCHVYLLPPTYWVWTYACYNTCLSLSLCVTNRRWRLRVHKHQYRRCCNVYRWGQRQRVKPKQHLPPHCQVMLIEFQQHLPNLIHNLPTYLSYLPILPIYRTYLPYLPNLPTLPTHGWSQIANPTMCQEKELEDWELKASGSFFFKLGPQKKGLTFPYPFKQLWINKKRR